MIWKFLTLLVVFGAAGYMIRRAFAKPPARVDGRPTPLERCPTCGAYRREGDICECERDPTP